MYYHVRLDKKFHGGGTDMDARVAWDFRSLRKALEMISRDYGPGAAAWRVEHLTDRTGDVMRFENVLQTALESTHQYIVMAFKDDNPALRKYDHYEFFISARDEEECPPEFSFSEREEAEIEAPEVIFDPNLDQSIMDILQAFDIAKRFDFVGNAFEEIHEFYGEEEDVPEDILKLKGKDDLVAQDFILLADECQCCGEEQLSARLYAAGYYANGEPSTRGEALTKLADLYMSSDWPKTGDREWDVMKAVDLLSEALVLGAVQEAHDVLVGMREQIFEEWDDDPDVDCFIRHYLPDALCLAAFCLGVGIGWKKDVSSATRLFEAASAKGYERAAYYLNEIHSGRV